MKNSLVLFFCLVCIVQNTCFAQTLSTKEKKSVAASLISQLRLNYVLQDSVPYIIAKFKENYKSPDFKKDQSPHEFSEYLTRLLRAITKDAHFAVLHNPTLSGMLSQPQGDQDALNQQLNAIGGGKAGPTFRKNFYFKKVEILDGNVGYLRLERMATLDESKATLDAAMAFLSNSDAFILDLRGNPGGAGGFIPYLISYFFPAEKMLLYKREMPAPAWDSISYHYTHRDLPGKRLIKNPVYILTDQFTGSAATNLAYTMQSFGRAKIVGENTGSGYRGAHSASLFPLPNGLLALIPIGKVVNAKTNTNWRAKGVDPDIKTKSSEALGTAYLISLEELIKMETDATYKKELISIYEEKKVAKSNKESPQTSQDVDKYVGEYEGGRVVWVEDNLLKYKRDEGPALILKFRAADTYKITLPSGARTNQPLPSLKFNVNPNGAVTDFLLVFDEDDLQSQGPFKKLN